MPDPTESDEPLPKSDHPTVPPHAEGGVPHDVQTGDAKAQPTSDRHRTETANKPDGA